MYGIGCICRQVRTAKAVALLCYMRRRNCLSDSEFSEAAYAFNKSASALAVLTCRNDSQTHTHAPISPSPPGSHCTVTHPQKREETPDYGVPPLF